MSKSADKDREPAAWTVERSAYVFRDKWISLRADSCRTQEGILIAPFYVLEYPDWVQIVALDEADNLVLIEQYRHGIGTVCLELPGGAVELHDTDPISAAQRELVEETGFEASNWELIATLAHSPVNQNNRCHIVLARNARPSGRSSDDPTERVRVLRVPVEQAVKLTREGSIIHAVHVAGLALTLTSIGLW
jgi:8-oxo-dGDP phosphatase